MKKIAFTLSMVFIAIGALCQNEPDLSVRFIRRTPVLNFVPYSNNPFAQGWPFEGDPVQWRAHVKNWSPNSYSDITFSWRRNGTIIKTGVVNFTPYSDETVVLDDIWVRRRDSITFEIDPGNAVAETTEANNLLMIYSDAISVNFYVEQSVYDYFHTYQKDLGVGTNSWDDWAQMLHVKRWNQIFQNAIFPDAPKGILDRIRVDSIVIVPDNALPLAGGLPSNNPNNNDRTVDLVWGFPNSLVTANFYSNHTGRTDDNPFYFESSLLHELGHARYLIDLYAFDISVPQVMIKEGDTLIAGSSLMPIKAWDVVYYNKWQSLMSGNYTTISLYEALALNQIAGQRAYCGNYNAPCNIGQFINDLPDNNYLKFTDQNDNIIQNACVEVYQARPGDGWYGKTFDDVADLMFTAGNTGEVNVGRDPFSPTSLTTGFGFTNMVAIVRIEKDNKVGYAVLEAADFNVEYWRKNTLNAHYNVKVNMLNCADFNGASCACAALLPVSMKSFYGTGAALSNNLYWETTSETGFSNFVVEKSTDGINFSTIATVAGCRQNTIRCKYEYIDKLPGNDEFYRLRLVDRDSSFTYSKTIRISKQSREKDHVILSPNPVTNVLNVKLLMEQQEIVTLIISNAQGMLITKKMVNAVKGENNFRIDVSQLTGSVYFLNVESSQVKQTLKVLKK